MPSTKPPLLVDDTLTGSRYARANAHATDRWLSEVFAQGVEPIAPTNGVALVAVGGYGHNERAPYSDVDVLLVHADLPNYAEIAEALWYPMWDRGLKVGYAVVTLEQAAKLVDEELHWATALLSTRHVAGDRTLTDHLHQITDELWRRKGPALVDEIGQAVRERHENFGSVAFQIEPQLKEGRGGLRDIHALRWAAAVNPEVFTTEMPDQLDRAGELLMDVRVALHRLEGRAIDTLTLDLQDELADAMGYGSGHDLMVDVAEAGRTISWLSDEAWSHWAQGRSLVPATVDDLGFPFLVQDGVISLGPVWDGAHRPELLVELAFHAAQRHLRMDRQTLAEFARSDMGATGFWDENTRRLFAGIFLAGRSAIEVVDDLDHFGLFVRLLPEWDTVRCCPQRNVMHTWTVDRHLTETAANASALAPRVARPDLLVMGALLHDIGKGRTGDHTEIGMDLIAEIGTRMGYPDEDVAILVDLCKHHLLLPDFATRRDLSDPGTITAVAAAVDSVEFLDMLAALTEADSIATGPATWGAWKAGLLDELVSRAARVLEGQALDEMDLAEFPTAKLRSIMNAGEVWFEANKASFTAVAPNEPLLLSRVAGALAISGLEVLDAAAYTDDDLVGACRFTVQPPATGLVDWDPVIDCARRALAGDVALTARVSQRAQRYQRFRRPRAATPPQIDVLIDNDVSQVATVLEVHAPDEIGLLYRVTQALAELRLDIRTAKVQTFGPQAVDSFYVVNHHGDKITAPATLAEVEHAIRFVLGLGSS